MVTQFQEWVERVRSINAAPLTPSDRRSGARQWELGDVLLSVPEEHRDAVAAEVGLTKGNSRSYWRTAEAWPPERRITATSWTVHRDLAKDDERFQKIKPGVSVREVYEAEKGRPLDRRGVHRLTDDELIDEIVRLMLSPRRKSLVPEILARLNNSKEGRKAARDRRSAGALKRLEDEIRQVQKEIRKRQADKPPRLRFLEVRRRLLDTEVNVEEIGLLANDPDDRQVADAEDWRELAERVAELGDRAKHVSASIINRTDALDAEEWSAAEDFWTIKELSGGDVVVAIDAEFVEED